MKNNNENGISCNAVRDLLPLYGENLTSPATVAEVKAHLARCQECRSLYDRLADSRAGGGSEVGGGSGAGGGSGSEDGEIDYLKKVRKKNRIKILAWVGATLAVILAVGLFKLFVYGWPVTGYVPIVAASGETINVSGVFYDSATVFSHFKVKETDRGKELVVYGCLPSFSHSSGSFTYSYEPEGEALNVNGARILADGSLITKLAFDLYEAKNPYIGDMSANGEIANLLGINTAMGTYENHLKTDTQPYSWRFEFKNAGSGSNSEHYNSSMTAYAYVLLALVENCDRIEWNDNQTDGGYKYVTADQATETLGKDIKEYAKTPESIQQLLTDSGVKVF